jgi:PAS domain S-box-containing protein
MPWPSDAHGIFDRLTDLVILLDRDGRVLELNRHAASRAGGIGIVGRCLEEAAPALLDSDGWETLHAACAASLAATFESRTADGASCECRVFPGRQDVALFIRDIAPRPDGADGDEQLHLALEAGQLGTWEFDIGRDRRRISRRTAAILGLPPDTTSTTTREWDRLVHPADRSRLRLLRAELRQREGEFAIDVRIVRPDGKERWVALQMAVRRSPSHRVGRVLGVIQDITERMEAQLSLRAGQERWKLAQQAAGIGGWEWDIVQDQMYYSPELCRLLGFDLSTDPREGFARVREVVHPDDVARFRQAIKDARAGRGRELEYRVLRPDGYRWILSRGRPLRDEAGKPLRMIGLSIDITERRQAEEELRALNAHLEERIEAELRERDRVRAALAQAQKMEALGQLTGGVAHDFNNLLTAVIGNLDLALPLAEGDRLRRLLRGSLRAAERGSDLTRQLLAFSRKQHLPTVPADLNQLLRGMGELLRRTLGGTVAVETDLAENLWPALVDPNQIELAVLNIALNARDAMPMGGTITVATRNRAIGAAGDLAAGDYVVLSIADTGEGMLPAVLDRALEPFFTTKEVGKGTGLGLSQVYGVMRQLGGSVRLSSAVGVGTVVELFLPRSAVDPAPRPATRGAAVAASTRPASLLVVDDDPDVRDFACVGLRELGYEVFEASSGRAALRIVEAGRRLDLLVVDFAMPGMNGGELAEAARRHRRDLKILYMTGYAEAEGLRLRAEDRILRKPFRAGDLARCIAEMLQPSPEGAA